MEVVEEMFLEVFKKQLNMALSAMVLLTDGVQSKFGLDLEGLFQPYWFYNSMVLR